MSNQRVQNLGAKFSAIWQAYLLGGTTNEFLTSVMIWREECLTDCKDANEHLIVSEGYKHLFQSMSVTDLAFRIVLGYMTAIKGILFKPHANSDLTAVLSCSHQIEHQLTNADVTGVRKLLSLSFWFLS
jgi:hypothetical protein